MVLVKKVSKESQTSKRNKRKGLLEFLVRMRRQVEEGGDGRQWDG